MDVLAKGKHVNAAKMETLHMIAQKYGFEIPSSPVDVIVGSFVPDNNARFVIACIELKEA